MLLRVSSKYVRCNAVRARTPIHRSSVRHKNQLPKIDNFRKDRMCTVYEAYWAILRDTWPLFLDPRPVTEFKRFHTVGCINIPPDNLESTELHTLPRTKERPIYITSGETDDDQVLANNLADKLEMLGYPEIYVVDEGIQGMVDHGFVYYKDVAEEIEKMVEEADKTDIPSNLW